MSVDCNNPKPAEIALCACKTSVDTYKRLTDAYDAQKAQYAADRASYERWLAKHNDWKNKTGDFERYRNFDANQEFNANDTDWSRDCSVCWSACNYPSSHGWADDNCKRWAGERGLAHSDEYYYNGNWWHDSGGGDGACGKKRVRYKCSRRPNKIDEWRNNYNGSEPKTDPQDGSKQWLNRAAPVDNATPPTYNGTCCTQILSEITASGGNVTIDNISQKCGAAPPSSPAPGPGPIQSSGMSSSSFKSDKSKKTLIGLGIGLMVLIFICIILIMMMDDDTPTSK